MIDDAVLIKLEILQGPEIRTGFLKDGKPIQLKQGQEILISTDYSLKGDENMICMSYKKLAKDVKPGSIILCSNVPISNSLVIRFQIRLTCLGHEKNFLGMLAE